MNNRPILIVEDNPDDQALAVRAFHKSNLKNEIVIANDGIEACKYLFGEGSDAPFELPAVVLLDLNMPKMSGLEVLSKIRSTERTKFLPVVIVTTSKEERDIVDGYSLGVNSYVRKPVDFNEFLTAVQNLGLYWLLLNEAPA